MIENKLVEYDHLSDSRSNFKHGHKYKLKSIDKIKYASLFNRKYRKI